MYHSNSEKLPVLVVTVLVAAVVTGWICWTNKYKYEKGDYNKKWEVSSLSSSYNFEGDNKLVNDFEIAVRTMQNQEIISKIKLTNNDKLMFYALYKQAILGDAPDVIPVGESWNVIQHRAKYDAWMQMKGLTNKEAAVRYVTAVEHFTSPLIDDWEKTDSDDDNDSDSSSANAMGPVPFSRPMELNSVENDHYDDAVNLDGSASIESRLLRAASENDVSFIHRLFLESSTLNVNHTDPTGQTALHVAADKGCYEVVKVLIEQYNADVNAVDEDGISVLQTCVVAGHVAVCVYLLQEAGANPDLPDADGDTPRSCAQDDDSLKHLFSMTES